MTLAQVVVLGDSAIKLRRRLSGSSLLFMLCALGSFNVEAQVDYTIVLGGFLLLTDNVVFLKLNRQFVRAP